jgi:hypothetical protein
MNEFQPFEHEVMASQNEKEVDYNLSESGVCVVKGFGQLQ